MAEGRGYGSEAHAEGGTRAALDHGTDATTHGERPHVTVVADWADLVRDSGSGEARWTGPLPTGDLRRLARRLRDQPRRGRSPTRSRSIPAGPLGGTVVCSAGRG